MIMRRLSLVFDYLVPLLMKKDLENPITQECIEYAIKRGKTREQVMREMRFMWVKRATELVADHANSKMVAKVLKDIN